MVLCLSLPTASDQPSADKKYHEKSSSRASGLFLLKSRIVLMTGDTDCRLGPAVRQTRQKRDT